MKKALIVIYDVATSLIAFMLVVAIVLALLALISFLIAGVIVVWGSIGL